MELAVGQVVVYGGHGPGRVVAREERGLGEERCEVVVLELAANLTVTLPVMLARESLRPLANESEMASVQRTLRTKAPASDLVWLKRHKETRAKLASGEAVGLAEAILGAQPLEVGFLEVLRRRLVVARDSELERKLRHPLDRIGRKPGNRRD